MPDSEFPASGSDTPQLRYKLEETKRIGRVLAIVQLVAAQPKQWRRRDLAARFEVSERQIDKDLQLVRHGLVLLLRHVPAGYHFDGLPRLAAAPLTFEESLALILAAQSAQEAEGIDSADLAAALSRLEMQFPMPIRDLLHQATGRRSRDFQAVHRKETLATLERAMAGHRKVALTYATATRDGAVTERVVQPYAVLRYVRSWYLVGYCELRQAVLMFKIDRIVAIELTSSPYTIPQDFDLDAYRGAGWGILRETGQPVERVELQFDAQAGRWVAEEQWHPRQVVTPRPDGAVRFAVDVAVTPELVRWVLGYGRHVRVLGPDGLRQCVLEEATDLVQNHTRSKE